MGARPRVLFLCTGNACRSQMAEGWLRHLAGDRIAVASAGTHPHGLDPRAVGVMAEAGVDIAAHTSDPVSAHLDRPPDVVVAVCAAAAESCPALPAPVAVLRWSFDDPAAATGTEEEVVAVFRRVRDEIRGRLEAWARAGFPPLSVLG